MVKVGIVGVTKSYGKCKLGASNDMVYSRFGSAGKLVARFDGGSGEISVGEISLLHAKFDGSTFKLDWLEKKWEEWKLHTNDPQFRQLIGAAELKLTKASRRVL